MALTPATNPPVAKEPLLPLFQEVLDEGITDAWYIIRQYDKWATARDTAVAMRGRFPDLTIRAAKGGVYARRDS